MALGVMCLFYSHHQTSGWLIKTKMVAWKPICHEIFCFNLHSGQTLIFCCKSLTVKFDVKYLFTTWFLETITFVFMMSQSSSDKKHINMWYQIASGTSNQRAKFVGFILQNCALKLHSAWKLSKYGVIYGPYFPVCGLNTRKNGQKNPYLDTFHAVLVFRKNTNFW